LYGRRGAVASAHPLATAAGQHMLAVGGNAADAIIAAQAVLCVIAPEACGLGGDMLALVLDGAGAYAAVTGTGSAPMAMTAAASDGPNSVTVPGIVSAWENLASQWGRLSLTAALAPAIELAQNGFLLSASLHQAVRGQRGRLERGGAADWCIARAAVGERVRQPELGRLLMAIAQNGARAFYEGDAAKAIVSVLADQGGAMGLEDLSAHRTQIAAPIMVTFGPWQVAVQPPPTQGVLLAMSLQALNRLADVDGQELDHICIELTEAAFVHRASCGRGAALLEEELVIDRAQASRRGGPRAYLHTAGVAASDLDGLTISSLVSVFDDFGSCVFVPDLGITLNNRAGGFTEGSNAARPGAKPVHTLAPAIVSAGAERVAMATPGADGQVQTLLQILGRLCMKGERLADAVDAPRWRSEGGALLIEQGHPAMAQLERRGHQLQPVPSGDIRFGAVVCAGVASSGPFALSDWRRECWSGVA